MKRRVVITGVGSVNASFTGGAAALSAWLASPRSAIRRHGDYVSPVAMVDSQALVGLVSETERRRLSRVSQLAVAAARVALEDARLTADADLGLVMGTEFGDLRSTMEFADGYLSGGPAGLSALLFPNTVMNTMAAATSIAVTAREAALTLNEAAIAGEQAVAHAAAAIAGGRLSAVLAGGVDQIDPFLARTVGEMGGPPEVSGEGATFLVLEPDDLARERGARVLGEVAGTGRRVLAARPHGVGWDTDPRAVTAALAMAGLEPAAIRAVYTSASGDEARNAWEARLLAAALPDRPAAVSLRAWLGQHAGVGALSVAAAAWTARSGRLPAGGTSASSAGAAMVHGVARGGAHVALVVCGGGDGA